MCRGFESLLSYFSSNPGPSSLLRGKSLTFHVLSFRCANFRKSPSGTNGCGCAIIARHFDGDFSCDLKALGAANCYQGSSLSGTSFQPQGVAKQGKSALPNSKLFCDATQGTIICRVYSIDSVRLDALNVLDALSRNPECRAYYIS